MKQIIQSLKTGKTEIENIPVPLVTKGSILIKTTKTLVSVGTEKMLVEFGKASLISKARQQPDKVKQVLNKIKMEGLLPTLETVFKKLEQPLPLGYCNVGQVIEVGEGVSDFKIGDRVASNGPHAEYVCVPKNLAVHIPDNVSDEEATFTIIGSIALQGVRLLNPNYGETVVVIGLGLIGLISVQILNSNGCNVIGVDVDDNKIKIANNFGITTFNSKNGDLNSFVKSHTENNGADGVIITASSNDNNIISQSANISRKRGKIILVGVTGLNLKRSDFYEKELTFQVSCSYGPGRYDDNYEQRGIDYPYPFVRWTEKRNFKSVLNAISKSKLNVKNLVSEIVDINDYNKIYDSIGKNNSIASIIDFSNSKSDEKNKHSVNLNTNPFKKSKGILGFIGAGNFTKMTMLPILKKIGVNFKSIASKGGVNGTLLAKKYNFNISTTDYKTVIQDKDIDLVFITTRHDKHSKFVVECLKQQKNVFVEKPLALDNKELDNVKKAYEKSSKTINVGFNRRFSPHSIYIKKFLDNSPISVIATMNAGMIPSDVWVHDMKIGGGRIIGEACHFIDLISFFTGCKISSVCMNSIGVNPMENTDNCSIFLKYENGSIGTINYFSNGSKKYQKERIEIYSQERTAVIDNFKKTTGFGFKNFTNLKTKIDKGHSNQFKLLIEKLNNGGSSLIAFDEIFNTSKASIAAVESLKTKAWVNI